MANFGIVSEWRGLDENQDLNAFRRKLKEGDMIQIKNTEYSQFYWGVCTQVDPEPKIVRCFAREFNLSREPCNYERGSVHEIGLDFVLPYNYIRINNSRDRMTAPKTVEEILDYAQRAMNRMGDGQFGLPDSYWAVDVDFAERARYPQDALDKRLDDLGRSPWQQKAEDLESFSWLLRTGDMVEFSRKNVYSHWAVVIGSAQGPGSHQSVVHRYGSGGACELAKKLIGTIKMSSFQEVIKDSRYRINNSWDRFYKEKVKPATDIDSFVKRSLGSEAFGKYNLAFNNCWHFCMQARYGIKMLEHTFLRTEWYSSAEDIRPLLHAGDIIEFKCRTPEWFPNRAIYIERPESQGPFASLFANKKPEVAHLSQADEAGGKMVVRLTSVDDFFGDVARDQDLRIYNRWDCYYKPKSSQDIVKYVIGSEGAEADPYFFVAARHGEEARAEARAKNRLVY